MVNTTFIGLDVHARTVVAAALHVVTGEIVEARMAADTTTVTAWVTRFW